MSRDASLGTGSVEYTEDRPIIHFASPIGSSYTSGDSEVEKPNP